MKPGNLIERTADTKRIYEGHILNLRVDDVILPNGRESKREVIEHNGAVGIVPIEKDGTVYMVRQYRYPFNDIILEIPAGKIDGDELPLCAANRELAEEVGKKAAELIYIGELRPSVAYLTEVIHLYIARGLTNVGQHLDDDEFLRIETYNIDTLADMVMSGDITDAKTIAAVLKTKMLKDQNKL